MSSLNPENGSEVVSRLNELAGEIVSIANEHTEFTFATKQQLETAATLVLGAVKRIDAQQLNKVRGEF